MNPARIKVYPQIGHWFAECPCNAYCKTTSMSGAYGWACDHRDEHRAASARAAAPGPADFDATAHIVYDADGVPIEAHAAPPPRFVDIALGRPMDTLSSMPANLDTVAALAVGA
ncbi:hypothetical protein LO763_22255 [Glycomyces sp. A-F 0318]|uniref:hypothetical protein n=1 Tax=Glycomyces amatae TaxID=2881355 RepID=UPI001E507038|nr:hypothetical protein [Glycomyces amatae]MCD0446341.1 hypothetical protein [Glycomyces amatae]